MPCKVPGQSKWRREFSHTANDFHISTWLDHVSDGHRHFYRRKTPEWCLIRGLVRREARRRGLL